LESSDSYSESWDSAERFQQEHSEKNPSGTAGMQGFKTIRKILEPHWISSRVYHPLWSRLWGHSAEGNYRWLSNFGKFLEVGSTIPHSESVIHRLGKPTEYLRALAELDFGVRLLLSGINCEFVPTKSIPTPDLIFHSGGMVSHVEITSLNPEQERAELEAISWPNIEQINNHLVGGGKLYLGNPRTFRDDLDKIRQVVKDAISEALTNRSVARRNIPGLLVYAVAPQDRAKELPKWADHFEMSGQTPLPKRDKIVRKIQCKAEHQLSSEKSSALVIYDRLTFPDEIDSLAQDHGISVKVETFSNLAAVIYIHPFDNPFAVANLAPKDEDDSGVTSVYHKLPNGEAEQCLIWPSSGVQHSGVVNTLRKCVTNYPANLSLLFNHKTTTSN
jgi:hypothetical protein